MTNYSREGLPLRRLTMLMREDDAARRDREDPELTVSDIARCAGLSRSSVLRWCMEAGIGRARTGKRGIERVVRWSEIESLRAEMGWTQ